MGRLEDRVAIVTGGGAGIARAVVEAFVDEGARVVVVDLDQTAGAQLEEEIGPRVRFVGGDVSLAETAEQAVSTAVEAFGPPSILVNGAQASRQAPFMEHTHEEFDLAFNTGVRATFNFMKETYPHLKAARGSVVNFGSGAALEGRATQVSYAAAKEAIRGLSRVAANEWALDGIRVNVVCPVAETGGVKAWADQFPDDYRKIVAQNPMGRWGDPREDIAPVVVFLASEDSRYMTGQTLMADGGATKLR